MIRLAALPNDKPVKMTIELPAPVHLDLVSYAEVLARASGRSVSDPGKLVRQCSHDSWQLIAHSKKFVINAHKKKGMAFLHSGEIWLTLDCQLLSGGLWYPCR